MPVRGRVRARRGLRRAPPEAIHLPSTSASATVSSASSSDHAVPRWGETGGLVRLRHLGRQGRRTLLRLRPRRQPAVGAGRAGVARRSGAPVPGRDGVRRGAVHHLRLFPRPSLVSRRCRARRVDPGQRGGRRVPREGGPPGPGHRPQALPDDGAVPPGVAAGAGVLSGLVPRCAHAVDAKARPVHPADAAARPVEEATRCAAVHGHAPAPLASGTSDRRREVSHPGAAVGEVRHHDGEHPGPTCAPSTALTGVATTSRPVRSVSVTARRSAPSSSPRGGPRARAARGGPRTPRRPP